MLKLVLVLYLPTVVLCQTCDQRDYGNGGTVCVCTSDYCDTIGVPVPVGTTQYRTYTSSLAGLRFDQQAASFVSSSPRHKRITLNSGQTYQSIEGWGGALTDSAGININSLPEAAQEKLLQCYFGELGIEYSLVRVPAGGTDFSTRAYSYDDSPEPDPELTNFALAQEDFLYKIPLLQAASTLSNGSLRLFASAWTAPKWMRTNGQYGGLGFLKSKMFQPWANYMVKFLDGYKSQGVEFWGVTTGNEPNTVYLPLGVNSVGFTALGMAKWIRENLGPTLRNSTYSTIKIMTHDDQRIFIPLFLNPILADAGATQYLDGIAVHWYSDSISSPCLLTQTHNKVPDKFILYTEACNGQPIELGSWSRGESYSTDIITNLNHWIAGWVDWNIVLDSTGGPSYINNYVDAPIMVNATAGEFYKQPKFYHLGHFSKFVPRGSVRIGLRTSTLLALTAEVSAVAFRRPDNSTAVVLLNTDDRDVSLSLVDKTRTANLDLNRHSITTILYW